MKKLITGLCLLACLSVGVLWLKNRREQARAAEAQLILRETEAYAAQQAERNQLLQEKLKRSHSQAAFQANATHQLEQQLAAATNSTKPVEPSPGAKLFKDPQMKG